MNKFYRCSHCGNLIGMVHDAGVPMMCCGQKMDALVPNTVEASSEKHLPVVTVDGDTIKVAIGSAAHPMVEEHFIEWVYVQTERGGARKALSFLLFWAVEKGREWGYNKISKKSALISCRREVLPEK